ncbi:hypothetical protein EDEG_01922 [Edhazardia aedis USNM 41457]|uniref:Uncharacterized protein n=1 Tax=Edhazardia aedis (strain USNM 41457) TaxID=1003232 RepID=J8ZVU9_EDHAE|nr:hypothetical protein EDEG_01922 [Edhazardia aedis USNM 41457]|eukprot:EJW03793.1 hypothetical protein EDEG_01922 [Edhazardia aedis USNM 41457]
MCDILYHRTKTHKRKYHLVDSVLSYKKILLCFLQFFTSSCKFKNLSILNKYISLKISSVYLFMKSLWSLQSRIDAITCVFVKKTFPFVQSKIYMLSHLFEILNFFAF